MIDDEAIASACEYHACPMVRAIFFVKYLITLSLCLFFCFDFFLTLLTPVDHLLPYLSSVIAGVHADCSLATAIVISHSLCFAVLHASECQTNKFFQRIVGCGKSRHDARHTSRLLRGLLPQIVHD